MSQAPTLTLTLTLTSTFGPTMPAHRLLLQWVHKGRLAILLLLLFVVADVPKVAALLNLPSFLSSKAAFDSFFSVGRTKTEVSSPAYLRHLMLPANATASPPLLSSLKIVELISPVPVPSPPHAVLSLLRSRHLSRSLAPHYPSDGRVLCLCIEGGGMRGCVAAGMAAGLMALGLTEAFDAIYGSSAGAVIGTYFVARQLSGLHPEAVYEGTRKESIWPSFKSFPSLSQLYSTSMSNVTSSSLPSSIVPTSSRPSLRRNVISRRSLAAALTSSYTHLAAERLNVSSASFPSSQYGGFSAATFIEQVMSPGTGVVPLDVDAFRSNSRRQTMNIVACDLDFGTTAFNRSHFEGEIKVDMMNFGKVAVRDDAGHERGERNGGAPRTVETELLLAATNNSTWARTKRAFFDFFSSSSEASPTAPPSLPVASPPPSTSSSNYSANLFSALTSSMSVPGVSGSLASPYFDALAYECIPYRSAVYTQPAHLKVHVLALRTRPAGSSVETDSDLLSQLIAAQFFKREAGEKGAKVARFFENLGPTYRYAEDILTLREGSLDRTEHGIPIPPREVVYGIDAKDRDACSLDESQWRRAHVLSLAIGSSMPDISPIEQSRAVIMDGFRAGFEAAYEGLKWAIAGDEAKEWSGKEIAEILFADGERAGRGAATKRTRSPKDGATWDDVAEKVEKMLPGITRDDPAFQRVVQAIAGKKEKK